MVVSPDVGSAQVPQRIYLAGRSYTPCSRDRGVAALLVAAGWILQRMPGEVIAKHRADCVRMISEAETIVIEVTPPIGVRIKADDRLLVELPAADAVRQVRQHGRWARAD
jgi:hypothetical protein